MTVERRIQKTGRILRLLYDTSVWKVQISRDSWPIYCVILPAQQEGRIKKWAIGVERTAFPLKSGMSLYGEAEIKARKCKPELPFNQENGNKAKRTNMAQSFHAWRRLLWRSSRYSHSLEERVHRKRAGDFLSADHHSGIRETDQGTRAVDRS